MKTKRQKRFEAAIRQAEYDKLTPQQKLDKLNKGLFVALKQREKIAKQMKGDN